MKHDILLPGDAGNLFDRLNGADLVVAVHDGDQDRVFLDRLCHVLGIDPAMASTGTEVTL